MNASRSIPRHGWSTSIGQHGFDAPGAGADSPKLADVSVRAPAHVSALDIWAFVLPAASFVEITVVGRLIVSEVLMLVMLPWLWSARDRLSLPGWFLVAWAGWLISQVLTDLVVGSTFADYTRGWAAIVFTFTDFAAILVLASTPRRARLFALGLAVGGVLGYFFFPNVFAAADPWKWAFALPVGFASAAGLSGPLGARQAWVTVAAFTALGTLNLWLGYRSLGGVSLLTAGYLVLAMIHGGRRRDAGTSGLRAAAGLAFLVVAVVGVLQLYDAVASEGLLGTEAQAKYQEQSGALGVLVGGRPEILVSAQAIIDSPVLGHGSWARDFTYVDMLAERSSSLGYEIGAGPSDIGLIPAHSYLMGSWVWAGLLGGVFWLAVGALAVWMLANLYAVRVALMPLVVFSTMLLLWNIAFSPYGFTERIVAGFGVTLCVFGLRLVRGSEADEVGAAPPRPPRNPRRDGLSMLPTNRAATDGLRSASRSRGGGE